MTVYDDLANKALCATCADAAFAIGYTGLMMTPDRTDVWVANYLSASRRLEENLPTVVETMRSGLTDEMGRFRDLPASERRLTVVLAGFWRKGSFAATISNCHDENGHHAFRTLERFNASYWLRNSKPLIKLDVMLNGAETAVDERLDAAVKKIRKRYFGASGREIAQALVAIIRQAAKDPTWGHLISPHCVSSVYCRSCLGVEVNDHFMGHRKKKCLPHVIGPTVSYKHIWIQPG